MSYVRKCIRCGDEKQVTQLQGASGQLCRSCYELARTLNEQKRPVCAVCELPTQGHPTCGRCGIFLGPKHLYQDIGGGLCDDCAKSPQERAGTIEDNLESYSMGTGMYTLNGVG